MIPDPVLASKLWDFNSMLKRLAATFSLAASANVGEGAPARSAGAPRLLVAGAVEDIICGALRLGCRVNQKPAIVATFLEPA